MGKNDSKALLANPSKKNKLTPRQKLFCYEYLKDLNATQAALRVGYSKASAHVIGSEILRKPIVRDFVDQVLRDRAERLELDSGRVLLELSRVGFSDISQAFDGEGNLKSIHEIPEETRRALRGVDIEALYSGRGEEREQIGLTKKIRMHDKIKALELLGRHLRLFDDGGQADNSIHIEVTINGQPERAREVQTRDPMIIDVDPEIIL